MRQLKLAFNVHGGLVTIRVELMNICIQHFDLHRVDVKLRMPFRYGIATMTDGPVIFARLRVEVDGRETTGIASDLLPPKWFTKIPAKPLAEEIAEMLRVIQQAGRSAVGLQGRSAFEIWRELYEAQAVWGRGERLPPLLSNFGVSLIERALLEALCRAMGKEFGHLLRSSLLGIMLDTIHPELAGLPAAGLLPSVSFSRATVRHTVGLADPLDDEEISPGDRLDDGLPQSLTANIKVYGLRHFKIKVNGELDRDLDRLSHIARVLGQDAPLEFAFSLDGNEQFKSMEEFRAFWDEALGRPDLPEFFRHLLFVEQPLHRDVALRPEVERTFARWPDRPPIIIDESDATFDDLPVALRLGYAGTSHKNCKGIFKGIANRCLLIERQRRDPKRPLLMSGEDLCNIGPVALLQDLAVMAALGIASVERNGHHYHAGLSQFGQPVQREILQHHGDLYHASAAGWPTLTITRGEIGLASVNRAPFGVGSALNVEQFQKVT